jgi:hypothetical protein
MKKFISAAIIAGALTAIAPMASATTITLTTINDGTVQNTGGPIVATDNAATGTLTRINTVSSRGVFEFDLSSISDTSTITSAIFGFTVSGPATSFDGASEFILEAYGGNGIIDIADFTTPGTTVLSGAVASTTTAGTVLSFALTDLLPLQSALAGNLLTFRLSVVQNLEQIRVGFLDSGGTATPYAPAFLTVDAMPVIDPPPPPSPVPLPAGLPLLLVGLGALGLIRRKSA